MGARAPPRGGELESGTRCRGERAGGRGERAQRSSWPGAREADGAVRGGARRYAGIQGETAAVERVKSEQSAFMDFQKATT